MLVWRNRNIRFRRYSPTMASSQYSQRTLCTNAPSVRGLSCRSRTRCSSINSIVQVGFNILEYLHGIKMSFTASNIYFSLYITITNAQIKTHCLQYTSYRNLTNNCYIFTGSCSIFCFSHLLLNYNTTWIHPHMNSSPHEFITTGIHHHMNSSPHEFITTGDSTWQSFWSSLNSPLSLVNNANLNQLDNSAILVTPLIWSSLQTSITHNYSFTRSTLWSFSYFHISCRFTSSTDWTHLSLHQIYQPYSLFINLFGLCSNFVRSFVHII